MSAWMIPRPAAPLDRPVNLHLSRYTSPPKRGWAPRPRPIPGPVPLSVFDAVNPFISTHVPLMWQALTREFGLTVTYVPLSNPALATPVIVIWKDGAMLEDVTPGRYSHIYIQNADIPVAPVLGDSVQNNGRSYDVVVVDMAPYYYSRLILQEAGPVV